MIREALLFLMRFRVAWHWYWLDAHREELYRHAQRAAHHRPKLESARQDLNLAERGGHQPSVVQLDGSRR